MKLSNFSCGLYEFLDLKILKNKSWRRSSESSKFCVNLYMKLNNLFLYSWTIFLKASSSPFLNLNNKSSFTFSLPIFNYFNISTSSFAIDSTISLQNSLLSFVLKLSLNFLVNILQQCDLYLSLNFS